MESKSDKIETPTAPSVFSGLSRAPDRSHYRKVYFAVLAIFVVLYGIALVLPGLVNPNHVSDMMPGWACLVMGAIFPIYPAWWGNIAALVAIIIFGTAKERPQLGRIFAWVGALLSLTVFFVTSIPGDAGNTAETPSIGAFVWILSLFIVAFGGELLLHIRES